jgi:uncharacterized protein with PQ loop repeat
VLATVLSGLVWSLYGVGVSSIYIVVANLSVLLAGLVTAVALRSRALAGAAAVGVVAVVAVRLGLGVPWIGYLGVVLGGALAIPQALQSIRRRPPAPESGPGEASGVSALSYALLAVTAALWLSHGTGIGDPLVVAPNLVTLPAALCVVWRLRQ